MKWVIRILEIIILLKLETIVNKILTVEYYEAKLIFIPHVLLSSRIQDVPLYRKLKDGSLFKNI